MGKYVLLLLALPVAELLLLLRLADAIGGWRVFLLLVASGLIGAQIARMAGLHVFAQSQKAIATGTLPSASVLNGALLLLAAVLLITPGVITDVLAIVLLIPWSRGLIGKRVVARIERAVLDVMHDNGAMLALARARDFAAARSPHGRTMQRLVLELQGAALAAA